jgi:hypothetical protein
LNKKQTKPPIIVAILHDEDEKLRRGLAEYFVLTEKITEEEKGKFGFFINDHIESLTEELTIACKDLIKKRLYAVPVRLPKEPPDLKTTGFSVFETIYKKAVTFPFDKFQTSRGKAAKYCRDITVELFKGKLDYEWYASSSKEIQNRTKTVLTNAWSVFEDKKIALFPGHSGLKAIIEVFDAELKTQKSLNLGEMFKKLVMPPYGFNIASAGLVLGIFISPRLETIGFLYQGKSITPSVWLNKAMPKNFILPEHLKITDLQKIKTDEWRTLLFNWENEQTHSGRVAFLQQAEVLKERIPLSIETLYERFKNLKEKAERSFEALSSFDEFINKQDKFYEIGLERKDVGSLSRTGYDLVNRRRQMEAEEGEHWTDEQIQKISRRIDQCRKTIQTFFDDWLPLQSCISPERVDSFRDKMIKYTCGNLKSLDLEELAKQTDQHTIKIIQDMQERQKVRYSVEAARSFMASHDVNAKTPVTDLTQWSEASEKLKNELKRSRNIREVPEIDECLRDLECFNHACIEQEKEHWALHSELIESSFDNIDDIETLSDRLRDVIDIFAGQDVEFEDLKKLERRLTMFREDFKAFRDLNVSNNELKKIVFQKIDDVSEAEAKDDLLPEWPDCEIIYKNMLKILLDERKARSGEWLATIFPASLETDRLDTFECRRVLSELSSLPVYIADEDLKKADKYRRLINARLSSLWLHEIQSSMGYPENPDKLSNLTADQCQSVLTKTNSIPEYVTFEDREKIFQFRKQIEKRLDALNVEGLLARYRKLPFHLQKEFLKIAANEFKKMRDKHL